MFALNKNIEKAALETKNMIIYVDKFLYLLKNIDFTPRTFVCISNLSELMFYVNILTNKCLF
ncbi:hypothetical protein SASK001_09450 [Staphylococcus argenteus]|uniref:Uncharacterized protein n=1 Tax=Staphylococcus argenteus TaxID=985002 RepID=A0A7U7PZ25_9STAP|nr:hypothetical protein BN1326_60458 [Staphylococcus argenteus]CRI27222.1 hypothetical protein BN1326_60458 [Staphylococcus argenteus]BCR32872.1 hypothetical protein SARG0275_12550 [Staphylococcus argenteus]GBU02237.1 hypothetical protein SARG0275_13170 [Staphylococcus argenteus]GJF35649.1 hypothetical protein SA19023_04040 [Staphylococcus argenteus]